MTKNIAYKEIRRECKVWGIDVTVEFSEGGTVVRTLIVHFDDEAQIEEEFTSRMGEITQKIQADLSAPPDKSILELQDIVAEATEYVTKSTSIPSVDKSELMRILGA